jgi:long-subunit fatty acid transport protein
MKKLIVLILILASVSINAQNYNDALRLTEHGILSGARALGMGNAYTALSNDFSGIAFNPAGLGLIKKLQLDASLNYNNQSTSTDLFKNTTTYDNGNTGFNQFGFVFPFPTYQGSLVFALGYNRYKDFNKVMKFDGYNGANNSMIQDMVSYNDDIAYELGLSYPTYNGADYAGDETRINGKLNQSGTILQEGDISAWSFAGAIEVQKNLFIGGSLNIISGEYTKNREYNEIDTKDNYGNDLALDPEDEFTRGFESFYYNDILTWDLSGYDAQLGILYKANDLVNLGASIKFPRNYTIKEVYREDAESFFTDANYYLDPPYETAIQYDITTPFEFYLGAAIHYQDLTLSGDAKIIDYTQMEFTDGLGERAMKDKNLDIKDLLQSVTNFNLGMEYKIPYTGIALRGGFMYYPSAFKGDQSDFDKKYVTAGIGFATDKNLSINIAYAHGWWNDFGDNYGSNLSRTFQEVSVNNLMFTVSFKF